jgi:PIN domain nuclease of toxin-antitoxin system
MGQAIPGFRPNPFDRMLIAQAQAEDVPLVNNEALFDGFGIRRIW